METLWVTLAFKSLGRRKKGDAAVSTPLGRWPVLPWKRPGAPGLAPYVAKQVTRSREPQLPR